MDRATTTAAARRALRRGEAGGTRAAGPFAPPTPVLERPLRRIDGGLVALVIVLALGSVVVWLDPRFPGFGNAQALDIAINVGATLVGAAVAILAWVRWRETGEPAALYESSAFVGLSVFNAVLLGIVIWGHEREFGLSSAAPGEAPIYAWTLTRLVAAVLLVLGATRSLRRTEPPMPPIAIAVAPTVGLLLVAFMLFAREATLPNLPSVAVIDLTRVSPLALGPIAAAVILVQVVIFAAFIVAAVLYRRLYLRDGTVSHAFLAGGLVFAAFSQLHFALDPVVANGIVTTSDALRLAFYAVLFMGIQAELESDLSSLRRANDELRRLSGVEAANAALAERARLAREIHDGLAQDLWYAKLKQGRLATDEELPEAARTTAREVLTAVDSALAEARQAVMAMRSNVAPDASLDQVLRSYVEDFADRFGVRAEYVARGAIGRLPPRANAEVLRVLQEALNNVRRHADATLVRVTAEATDRTVKLTVADNGRGFEPQAVGDDRFGLRGMRERAELIGAQLAVESRPADGTTVTLEVPWRERAG